MAAYLIARTLWTEDGLPAMIVVFLAALVYTVAAYGVAVLVDRAWPGWASCRPPRARAGDLRGLVTPRMFRLVQWERRMLRLA